MEPQPGWDTALGLHIEELTPTRVVAFVDIDERHQQGYGIVHGGVWASVVESVASHGAAVAAQEMTGNMAVVGVANSTDFLRPHRTGRVRATGTPILTGRTQQIWLVEIEREDDGKLVARGQLRVQNLTAPPEQRG
jgi:1,4-dihydroxy-2-naphthoyl-CoA hydrolase